MLGAMIGDIVGSRFEWNNHKSKNFQFLHPDCRPTDDSIMSLAVAKAIVECNGDFSFFKEKCVASMQKLGRKYPDAGYGGTFFQWLFVDFPQAYGSWGNGSAMRVSPCGFAASSLDEALDLAKMQASVSHDHPEGIKGAQAVAAAIYLAKNRRSKQEIRSYITENFYKLDFTLDEIRPYYEFDVSCQGSVPQALEAFFEADGFEDAVRCAVSIGGDSDTIAAITGGIAEAFYGIPDEIRKTALTYLDIEQLEILYEFEKLFP